MQVLHVNVSGRARRRRHGRLCFACHAAPLMRLEVGAESIRRRWQQRTGSVTYACRAGLTARAALATTSPSDTHEVNMVASDDDALELATQIEASTFLAQAVQAARAGVDDVQQAQRAAWFRTMQERLTQGSPLVSSAEIAAGIDTGVVTTALDAALPGWRAAVENAAAELRVDVKALPDDDLAALLLRRRK